LVNQYKTAMSDSAKPMSRSMRVCGAPQDYAR
jgi:hypothetical protein